MDRHLNTTDSTSPSAESLVERDAHLTPLSGAKCVKCGSTKVFQSRSKFTDIPFLMLGFEPCRCGQCLARFRRWKLLS